MDDKLEMRIRQGYASIFDESQADEIQEDLFPDLDETAEFDLEGEAEEAAEFLKNSQSVQGEAGVRLRNYDAADRDTKVEIARAIKAFWESRSFMPDDPDTVIVVSGTQSLSEYEPSLSGRVYAPC